jgi:hypothetical protein
MPITTMTIFDQISVRIIKEQELIIGPVAWEEAQKVSGLTVVSQENGEVSLNGDPKEILNRLVAQYSRLFGKVSSEVCREAAQDLIVELPKDQIPDSLQ